METGMAFVSTHPEAILDCIREDDILTQMVHDVGGDMTPDMAQKIIALLDASESFRDDLYKHLEAASPSWSSTTTGTPGATAT